MKNITLSVEDEVLREARKYAAERETTVNALVRDYLSRLIAQERDSAKVREELAQLSDESEARLGPDWKWSREDAYDRPLLSGHEHSVYAAAGRRQPNQGRRVIYGRSKVRHVSAGPARILPQRDA
jgi:hypothetical protein